MQEIQHNPGGREIFLSDPVLTTDEIEALSRVIQSGWITMGERVFEFEKTFAHMHDAADAVAVASCTAALHLIFAAFGLKEKDEVLVPSLTFAATVNSILYTGASPVFADIESINRPHIDIADAERKVGAKTKAVVVMHYGGWTCQMEAWRAFADRHGLILIEDAAHTPAHGKAGRFADATAFSFYGNKNMTTAEGGMIIAGDEEITEKLRRLRSHGMTTLTLDRRAGHAFSYDVTNLGYNYRLDELRAAIGLVQLQKLKGWNKVRNSLLTRYRDKFQNSNAPLVLPFESSEETTAHLCPVLLGSGVDREHLMRQLREKGVHSSIHYPPVHRFTYYKESLGKQNLPITEQFSDREISLPIHPSMTLDDVDYVVEKLTDAL